MNSTFHPLTELFEQLGLPSDRISIENFLCKHAPMKPSIVLSEADFWTPDQRNFLNEELLNDADWAEAIDLLNSQLRQSC
ncbi:DUF2789 family protein [Polynucleobacter sp. AP-Nino-20-G2]|uniref:DUF2789 family protein n=1 Tax=Polynucleobacter sp. AP-Nino-20-G2 TaxID=2576917 RepID=UPI001BFD189C|nr:DUF2789 family protein [Polynucleobacter sp. AP-Nino-20-G2]QWE17234.1 DUF2789 domain-containing protein [Polynucleobacter sp. AP-Nino-20-G2]